MILGVIESQDTKRSSSSPKQLSKTEDILKFKQDKNIWITLQKERVK